MYFTPTIYAFVHHIYSFSIANKFKYEGQLFNILIKHPLVDSDLEINGVTFNISPRVFCMRTSSWGEFNFMGLLLTFLLGRYLTQQVLILTNVA